MGFVRFDLVAAAKWQSEFFFQLATIYQTQQYTATAPALCHPK
jgi:hypothetical protein